MCHFVLSDSARSNRSRRSSVSSTSSSIPPTPQRNEARRDSGSSDDYDPDGIFMSYPPLPPRPQSDRESMPPPPPPVGRQTASQGRGQRHGVGRRGGSSQSQPNPVPDGSQGVAQEQVVCGRGRPQGSRSSQPARTNDTQTRFVRA